MYQAPRGALLVTMTPYRPAAYLPLTVSAEWRRRRRRRIRRAALTRGRVQHTVPEQRRSPDPLV